MDMYKASCYIVKVVYHWSFNFYYINIIWAWLKKRINASKCQEFLVKKFLIAIKVN